jgi:hypothetical protein
LSERIITKWALRTEDCEGEGVYELRRIIKFEPLLLGKKNIPLTEVAVQVAERATLEHLKL